MSWKLLNFGQFGSVSYLKHFLVLWNGRPSTFPPQPISLPPPSFPLPAALRVMSAEDIHAMERDMEWKVVDMDSCLEGNPFWFEEGSGEEEEAKGPASDDGKAEK